MILTERYVNAMEQNELNGLTKKERQKEKTIVKVTNESNSGRTRKQNPQGVSEQE